VSRPASHDASITLVPMPRQDRRRLVGPSGVIQRQVSAQLQRMPCRSPQMSLGRAAMSTSYRAAATVDSAMDIVKWTLRSEPRHSSIGRPVRPMKPSLGSSMPKNVLSDAQLQSGAAKPSHTDGKEHSSADVTYKITTNTPSIRLTRTTWTNTPPATAGHTLLVKH